MSRTTIPVLDLNEFVTGDPVRKSKFVKDLGKAYEEIGFVSIRNHGLNLQIQEDLYEAVKRFFNLPLDVKKTYEIKGLAGQRGYTSFGIEQAKGSKSADLKEFFQFGQSGEGPHEFLQAKNVHVSELPDFTPLAMQVYKTLESTGSRILQAIALYLKLDEFYFNSSVERGNSILRAIHYPPITAEPKNAVRAAEHEDINLITLLMGASAEGLEVLNKSGQWIPVVVSPEEIVVNVGDMLQRLTNNKLKSTTHRVVNPPKEKWSTSRFSIPFFLHPLPETSLKCLDECIGEEGKLYEDITAGEYLNERLQEIGLK